MNSVALVGRLTKEPEMRYIPNSGTPVVNFTIAIDRNYKKSDGTKETDFIPVEAIGKLADIVAKYISKGRLVSVEGSLRVDRYKNQSEENRTFTKVLATSVQALDSNKNKNSIPQELDHNGFHPIDDDEIPF